MNAVATLSFQSTTFDIVSRNGQPWLRLPQIGAALGHVLHAVTICYSPERCFKTPINHGQTAPSARFCHARIPFFGQDGANGNAARTAGFSVLNILPARRFKTTDGI